MRIGFVCTNYNNSDFTLGAIKSLNLAAAGSVDVVIVDNDSKRDEFEKLTALTRIAGVQVIRSEKNVGYFSGLNIGIKHLRKSCAGIDWMIIGNNDLEFAPDFFDAVDRLSERLVEHPVISPDIVTLDGIHQNPHVVADISRTRELFYDLYYSNYYIGWLVQKLAHKLSKYSRRGDEDGWQEPQKIIQGHGACYILTPKFFSLFEELWAPTFMMGEEFFLSKQLSDVGSKVFYEPSLRITHHWHGSLEQVPSKKRWEMCKLAHKEYRKYVKAI